MAEKPEMTMNEALQQAIPMKKWAAIFGKLADVLTAAAQAEANIKDADRRKEVIEKKIQVFDADLADKEAKDVQRTSEIASSLEQAEAHYQEEVTNFAASAKTKIADYEQKGRLAEAAYVGRKKAHEEEVGRMEAQVNDLAASIRKLETQRDALKEAAQKL